MMDRYSQLVRAIPLPMTKAPHVAMLVLENWIMPYKISDTVMMDNGPQFVSESFVALWASMGTKLVMTTEYCHQANGQVERFNMTLVARLRHYIGEHQND